MKKGLILIFVIFSFVAISDVELFENPLIYHRNDLVKIIDTNAEIEVTYIGYHRKKVRLDEIWFRDPVISSYSGDLDLSKVRLSENYPSRSHRKGRIIERDLNFKEDFYAKNLL